MDDDAKPAVSYQHLEDTPFLAMKSQQHGDRRVSVWLRLLVDRPDRSINHTRYDPGLVLERHGHASDHYILIIAGEVRFGEEVCRAGSMIELPVGATFGPIVVGDDGAELVEVYFGDKRPVPADPDEYLRILAEKGIERLPPPVIAGREAAPRYDT
jgi:quercetin dioxygenase-like cupin family protein